MVPTYHDSFKWIRDELCKITITAHPTNLSPLIHPNGLSRKWCRHIGTDKKVLEERENRSLNLKLKVKKQRNNIQHILCLTLVAVSRQVLILWSWVFISWLFLNIHPPICRIAARETLLSADFLSFDPTVNENDL